MVIDGKERNVVNVWHHHDISAGDDLVLRLKPMPIPKAGYTLNHYYKRFVQKSFEASMHAGVALGTATHVWQLVPDIFSLDIDPQPASKPRMPRGLDVPADFAWQEWGYWHIARSQIMFRKYSEAEYYNNDMANQLKTNHLDLTFAPTWQRVPGAKYDVQQLPPPAVDLAYPFPVGTGPESYRTYVPKGAGAGGAAAHIAEAMPAEAAQWAPRLGLESMRSFLAAPMPPPPPAAAAFLGAPADADGEREAQWGCDVDMLSAAAPAPAPELLPPAPAAQPSEGGLGALMSQAKRRKKAGPQ
jgi:hypothetical protein